MTFKTASSILSSIGSETSPQKRVLHPCFLKSFAKAGAASPTFKSQCTSSKSQSQAKKPLATAQENRKFFTKRLFSSSDKTQCSYEALAKLQGITRRGAIEQIKKDIASGYLYKELTSYKCPKYKPLLHGENIYRLTDKGRITLGRKPLDPGPSEKEKKQLVKDKELSKAISSFFHTEDKKKTFEQVTQLCPKWWLEDLSLLKATLKLLQDKIDTGYRVRSIPHWVSHAIKENAIGFRRKVARKWRRALLAEDDTTFHRSSPYIQEVFSQLKALIVRGLDTSEKAIMQLFRKGTDHLGIALRVFTKAFKVRVIRNINAFLNWLISFKDPFDFFNKRRETYASQTSSKSDPSIPVKKPSLFSRIKAKFRCKKQSSIPESKSPSPSKPPKNDEPPGKALYEWTKAKLSSIKDRCVFLQTSDKPASMKANKIYADFAMCKKEPLKSYIKVYFYWNDGLYGRWSEDYLSLRHPQFKERFLSIFFSDEVGHGRP